MTTRALVVALALAGGFLPLGTAHAQDSAAVQQLLDNAAYWKQRGRSDKVIELYEKILRSNPTHEESLAELAIVYAQQGDEATARSYMAKLQKAHPSSARLAAVRGSLSLGGSYQDLLARARSQANSGNAEGAVATYRELFGSEPPTGAVALEFYQTLGGTPGGWDEARRGLERLHAKDRNDSKVELALARHLTYRESTRRDGIDRLQRLSRDTRVGKAATESWRQALGWLGANGGDVARLQAYLGQVGEDEVIRRKLASARTSSAPRDTDLGPAFDALDTGDLDAAETAFRRELEAHPGNGDALLGLGLVMLRREDYAAAERWLGEARDRMPGQADAWETPLRSAAFWRRVREAEALADSGGFAAAMTRLEEASALDPSQAIHAEMAMGNVLAKQGDTGGAEAIFQQVLAKEPENVGALEAMVRFKLANGDVEGARATNERLRELAPDKALGMARMQSELLRQQAALVARGGEAQRAEALLEESVEMDPSNAWALFDLLNLRVERGDIEGARAMLERIKAAGGDQPRVRLMAARLLAQEQRYGESLTLLDEVSDAELEPGLARLAKQIRIEVEASLAVQRAVRDGQVEQARRELLDLQGEVGDDAEMLALVGLAWSDLGDSDRARSVVQRALAMSGGENATIRLQLAAIQLREGRDDEVAKSIATLKGLKDLTSQEQQGVDDLEVAYTVRRADRLRNEGRHTEAYDVLKPALDGHPEDIRLVNALGRILYSAGEMTEAGVVFERVLSDHPDDVEALQGAALAALQAGRRDRARELLDTALATSPGDPGVHLTAGKVAAMMGNDGRAMASFSKALEIEETRLGMRSTEEGASDLPALQDDTRLSSGSSYDAIVRSTGALLRGADDVGLGGARPDEGSALRGEILREMDIVVQQHRYAIGASIEVRRRIGQDGLSSVTEVGVPIQGTIPTGFTGALELMVRPTYLDNGVIDASDDTVAPFFGTYALEDDLEAVGLPLAGTTGVSFQLGWRHEGYRVWAGTTPVGTPLWTVIGGVELGQQLGAFGFRLKGERTPVIDSLLSYAGQVAPRASVAAPTDAVDRVWGGVTRNGGRLDLSYDPRPALVYLYGGFHYLMGTNVLDNTQWEAGAGFLWRVVDKKAIEFRVGIASDLFGYGRNQRFFTFGHGGYFSPQFFVTAGIPLQVEGETGRVVYRADVRAGVNYFTESGDVFYPTNSGFQSDLEALAAAGAAETEPVTVTTGYAERSSVSFAFNLDGEVGVKVTDGFVPSLYFKVFTASQYTEIFAGLRLRYSFPRRVKPTE